MSAARRRVPSGRALKLVAVLYFAALAAMPFAHHDLACHLKSSTHCTICLVGTSADDPSAQPAVPQVRLADAGRADTPAITSLAQAAPSSSSGRSPPAVPVS